MNSFQLLLGSKTSIQTWNRCIQSPTLAAHLPMNLPPCRFRCSRVRSATPTHHVIVKRRTRTPTARLRPVLIRKRISELTAKTKRTKKPILIKKTWSTLRTPSRAMEESVRQSATRARSSSLRMRSTSTR